MGVGLDEDRRIYEWTALKCIKGRENKLTGDRGKKKGIFISLMMNTQCTWYK